MSPIHSQQISEYLIDSWIDLNDIAMKTQLKWNEEVKVCVGRLLSKAVDVKGLTDGGQSGDGDDDDGGGGASGAESIVAPRLLSQALLKQCWRSQDEEDCFQRWIWS